MRILLFSTFCLLTSISAVAGQDALIGEWAAEDTASMAIFGVMKITPTDISWGGHNKNTVKCNVTYTIETEKTGVSFTDVMDNRYVTGPKADFTTFLLKLNGGEGKCAKEASRFRLTFPDNKELNALNMIEYDQGNNSMAWLSFSRKQ